jgi:general secretion pathway protein G
MKKQDEGFTLIELLIVIVILGILAAVVVFAVNGITDRGQDNACDTDERTMRTAAEAYYADNSSYPADEATLVSSGFLSGTSEYNTYALVAATTTGSASFTITAAGSCV